MPFSEFIISGDLKFLAIFIICMVVALIHFIKKIESLKKNDPEAVAFRNSRINASSFWILIVSILSLLLGLMHSFYFIGKSGGIAPGLLFQGISFTLITPIVGLGFFIICRFLKEIYNTNTLKSKL